ncbi:MAG: PH domain-containing protein [Patescibacteria group bacterium]|nr:PH domain-containing protein [Patescibacteria group bacterium]
MVSLKSVEKQLSTIRFNTKAWGKAEINELPNILMDDEKIFECVNGTYEGGFALLCATNIRLLLIDKKPLKFLTVEDLRFDMINQIDYSHRLMGARINISTGVKNLKFTSFNQQRLRKLINHIQHQMADIKREQSNSAETQQQHLERINQQLQAYLLAQHQQQEDLRRKLEESQDKAAQPVAPPELAQPIKPAPELADFLYAQSLMQQHQATQPAADTATASNPAAALATPSAVPAIPAAMLDSAAAAQPTAPTVTSLALQMVPLPPATAAPQPTSTNSTPRADDDVASLVEAGRREIFGSKALAAIKPLQTPLNYLNMEVHPLKIAYAKLPTLLRNRKFSAPSLLPKPDETVGLAGTSQVAGA